MNKITFQFIARLIILSALAVKSATAIICPLRRRILTVAFLLKGANSQQQQKPFHNYKLDFAMYTSYMFNSLKGNLISYILMLN